MNNILEKFLSPAKFNESPQNRLVKVVTFESTPDDNSNVFQKCIHFRESFAKGGVYMITLAYHTPEPDGRTQGHY